MTDIQQILISMMDEIDEISQREGLDYILANQTAARVWKKDYFFDEVYDFQILMPIKDILKLQEAVRNSGAENRAFESWEDNEDLHQMVYRYVDKGSLLIDFLRSEYFKKPGIAITIYPARTGKISKKLHRQERFLQLNKKIFWKSIFLKSARKILGTRRLMKLIPSSESILKERGLIWGGKEFLFGGRKKLAQSVIRKTIEMSGMTDGGYSYISNEGKVISLPKDLFATAVRTSFEGREYRIAKNMQEYLKKLYGKEWDTKKAEELPLSSNIRVFCGCDLPYEEYMELVQKTKGYSVKEIIEEKQSYNSWRRHVYNPMEKKVSSTFQLIKSAVDRIDVWHRLRVGRAVLKRAYQEKDIPKMREVLKEYLRKVDFYLAKRIGFYIDDEIFDCARLIWEQDGCPDKADRVYELVPSLYKRESVDDYFASRGELDKFT